MSARKVGCVERIYIKFIFNRLMLGEDGKQSLQIYLMPRIRQFMTITIWCFFAYFFQKRIKDSVQQICPNGRQNALGGRRKRNLLKLNQDLFMVYLSVILVFFDNCLIISIQIYYEILGNYIHRLYKRFASYLLYIRSLPGLGTAYDINFDLWSDIPVTVPVLGKAS